MSRLFTTVKTTLVLVTAVLCSLAPVRAQEAVQIDILNIPSVLPSPFVSDFEDAVLSGRYQAQMNYISTGSEPVDLEFVVRLYRNNELLVEEYSQPEQFHPGMHTMVPIFDYIDIDRRIDEIISDLDGGLAEQVLQTGTLPEGRYRIELDAQPVDDRQVRISRGIADFTVTYPQPPRITSPADGADITMANPVFSWSPVITDGGNALEYEFYMVEVHEGQTPEEAIDANRSHHDQVLFGETSLVYTDNMFPLEEGATYAWQVTANEINDELPIRNHGESEIHTFTYHDDSVDPGDLADLEEIELVPGVLTLTGLENLPEEQIDKNRMHLELNGEVQARFEMNFLGEPVEVAAEMRGLQIQQTGLDNPVVTGGRVSLDVYSESGEILPGNDQIILSGLEYHFPAGFTGVAEFTDEELGGIRAEGQLSLSNAGAEGILEAQVNNLLNFESDIVEVDVNRVYVSLPGEEVWADGEVTFLGEPAPCSINRLNLLSEQIHSAWSCDVSREMDIVGNDEHVRFQLHESNGTLTLDRETNEIDYDLNTGASFAFAFEEENSCDIELRGNWASGDAPEFDLVRNSCSIPEPELDLGFAQLHLSDFELDHFSYDAASGQWDFDLPFYASINFPVFNDWKYAPDEPFRLTPSGIDVPGFQTDRETPDFKHEGLNLVLEQVGMENFILPWSDEESVDEAWQIEFEGEASVAEVSGLPLCLGDSVMRLENGQISSGNMSADLELATFSDCALDFRAGHTFIFSALGGSIYSEYHRDQEEPFATASDLFMEGRYEPGAPLSCGDADSGQETTADIAFSNGILEGQFGIEEAACEMPVGVMTAELNEASIKLWAEESEQQAHLSSDATLHFSEDDQVSGNLLYDIMGMEFKELDFSLDDPFTWDIPPQDPVFSFHISEAELGLDGLFIDGRHEVQVGDETFGTTFDEVVQDIEDRRISSGEVFFDQSFAMILSFDEGLSSPEFSAVPLPEDEDDEDQLPELPDNGLYMELGGEVGYDSTGVTTSGEAEGIITLEDLDFDDVTVAFSDNFAFQVSPFGVSSGQIDFHYNDTRIAYLDASGFHPVISGFADEILPDKLPAPHTQVAYFRLRDSDGELLVDFEEPEPGLIELQTLPDTPVELVVPALDESNPPAIGGVEFEDFTITATPGNFKVDSGNAWVTISEDNPYTDLADQIGVPFDVREIRFGDTEHLTDEGNYLQILGDLRVFDHPVTDEANTMLKISGGGLLSGEFDLQNLNADVPVVPESDRLLVGVNNLSGSLSLPVLSGGGINYDFDVDADFKLANPDTEVARLAEMSLNLIPGSFTITEFEATAPDSPFTIGLPGFDININEIISMPVLEYSQTEGWDWEVELDADFAFSIGDQDPFTIPMNDLVLHTDGVTFPAQKINDDNLDGLQLPTFELAGFEFTPLQLKTEEEVTFNWYEGTLTDVTPYLDFEVHLPDFEYGNINPPDGFTFTGVTLQDGFLTGSMQVTDLGPGLVIPVGPPDLNPPEIRVEQIDGALEAIEEAGETTQQLNLSLSGSVEEIPFFDDPDSDCEMDVQYDLEVSGGEGIQGSIDNIEPCGSAELGPLTLSAGTGSLHFDYEDEQQQVVFDGSLTAGLQGPENEVTAQGNVEFDLINGQILDGEIAVNEPFRMEQPFDGPSFLEFEVYEAELSPAGFMIDGAGHVDAGATEIDVAFNQFTFGMPDFGVVGGSAEISAGLGMEVGFSPLTASITDTDVQQIPVDDGLIMVAESEVTLDASGLNFDGNAGASLRFAGEEMASLHVAFEDNFTFSKEAPVVEQGQASLYTDEDEEDLLAVFNENGIDLVETIIAQLPDTLGLPSSDIAYAVIKDESDELLINAESNDDGGYTLATEGEPLSVYFPALEDAGGDEKPYVDAEFILTTDDSYIPNGGEITLASSLDLEPHLNLPVSVDSISVGSGELATVISARLPEVFGDEQLSVMTALNNSGFTEASIDFGQHIDEYDADLAPAVERELASTLSGDSEENTLLVGLYGAEFSINSPAAFQLSGFVETSLLENQDGDAYPVFFSGGYDDGWNLDVDLADDDHDSPGFGFANFNLDQHEGLGLSVDNDEFIVTLSGTLSFEEMIGEDLQFYVQNMQIGANELQDSPQMVFNIDEAGLTLEEEQTFDFFEGAFSGSFTGASLSISGSTLTASVDSGDLTFLEEEMQFHDLEADTDGNFCIGGVGMDEIDILGEHLRLQSVGMDSCDQEDELALSARFFFLIPDPVDQNGLIDVTLGRNQATGEILVDADIPDESGFNPEDEDEIEIELGSQVSITLTDILLDIDPRNISDTHMALAGNVDIMGSQKILLGTPNDVENNPGISVKAGRTPVVKYNITGNGSFHFEHSLFEVMIETDVVSSNEEAFEITLNGSVSNVQVPGIEVEEAGFKGMLINSNGIDEIGNFDSNVKLSLFDGIATLELGTFIHKSNDDGFNYTIADGFDRGISDLEDAEEETQELELVEYLCFGPCEDDDYDGPALELTLGGSGSSSGSFGGELKELVFYETIDGDISLAVSNLSIELAEYAEASASLLYQSEANGGSEFFAVGSASIEKGGSELSAMIAGGFSTMESDLSFGLFAAVSADTEVPIIPGVLSTSGFGGGFFYRPDDDHLKMVYEGLDDVRGEPIQGLERTVTGDSRPGDFLSTQEDNLDLRFSFMLYAELTVFSVLEGTTFLEITDSYLALDADGVVLDMDSSPAMGGAFFVGASYSEGMHIQSSLQALVEFDPVIEADASVEFFVGMTGDSGQSSLEFGLIGEIDVELFRGLMGGGTNTIMASNDGFLLEVDMSAGIDRSALTLTGYLRGSIWNLTYDGADIPFGAYGTAGGEISIAKVISGEALLQAAFARKASGDYEMFGYGEACGSVLGIGTCGSAWFTVYLRSGGSVGVDGGRGDPDFNDDLVAQAQAQADEFEAMIQDAMDGLQAELGQISIPTMDLTDEQLAQAGYNFWTSESQHVWRNRIYSNEQNLIDHRPDRDIPPMGFDGYLNFHDFFGKALRDHQLRNDPETSWEDAEDQVNQYIQIIENTSESTIDRLEESVVKAIEFESEATQLRDETLQLLAESPANIINQPTPSSLGEGNIPEFEVDHEAAAEQSMGVNEFSEVLDELNNQVHAVVDSIEHNLGEMGQLLGTQYTLSTTRGGVGRNNVEIVDVTPSVNSVSEIYLDALAAIDRYYALKANRFWHQLNYALFAKSEVEGVYNVINGRLIEEMYWQFLVDHNNFMQGNRPQELMDGYANKIAERRRILEQLLEGPEPSGSPYDFSDYPDVQATYDELVSGNDYLDMDGDIAELEEQAQNLLLNIHILGTDEYVQHRKDFISDEFIEDHQDYRQSVVDLMLVNSEMLDDFYSLKANMYGTLYTIIDNYVEVRTAFEEEAGEELDSDDDMLETYQTRRQEILEILDPPEITNISVNTSIPSPHYYGSAEIFWDASHPQGITDVSMAIKESDYGTSNPADLTDHLSIGVPDQITYYSYLKTDDPDQALYFGSSSSPEEQTRQVDISLRVRGEGGMLARRQASFELPVGEEGHSTDPDDNILPQISTPPEDLQIDLETYYSLTTSSSTYMNFNPITNQYELNEVQEEIFWTDNPDFINVRALANEPYTSIERFEYSVGSSYAGTDVIDFTRLVGDTELYPDEPGSWTDLIEATTRIINMEPGEPYHLTVDAYNIDGQYVREHLHQSVRYDDTPPETPEAPEQPLIFSGSDDLVLGSPFFSPTAIEAEEFIDSPPQYNLPPGPQQGNVYFTDAVPTLGTVTWEPSSDDMSGVSHYEYLVTTSSEPAESGFTHNGFTTTDTEVTITSGEGEHADLTFDFDEELYVHIRAVNHAGLKSDVLTYGPNFPFDPNPPEAPEIAGYEGSDHIRIYLKERSYDAESGMLGYQYSVGTSPGETDIRSWPDEEDQVDYEEDQEILYGPPTAPYIAVPKEDLPEGEELYFNVRAVNNQLTRTGLVSTGPVIIDDEPPEEPLVSLEVNENTLEVDIDQIYDAVSGVAAVEAYVTHPDIPHHLITTSWQDIGNLSSVRHDSFSIETSYDVPPDYSVHDLTVHIRVTNAAGLQTVVSEEAPSLPTLSPQDFSITTTGLTF